MLTRILIVKMQSLLPIYLFELKYMYLMEFTQPLTLRGMKLIISHIPNHSVELISHYGAMAVCN